MKNTATNKPLSKQNRRSINRSKPKGDGGNLVLSRHVGESVMIGDNIIIMVSSINGNKVGIAIKAPRDVPVMRKELYDEKKGVS